MCGGWGSRPANRPPLPERGQQVALPGCSPGSGSAGWEPEAREELTVRPLSGQAYSRVARPGTQGRALASSPPGRCLPTWGRTGGWGAMPSGLARSRCSPRPPPLAARGARRGGSPGAAAL